MLIPNGAPGGMDDCMWKDMGSDRSFVALTVKKESISVAFSGTSTDPGMLCSAGNK